MNFWHSIVLGVVEGLTEFLPVSSTGHLMLAARLLGLQQTEFMKTFEIAIQTGAILAVVVLFGKRFLVRPEIWGRVLAAFVPTAAIGFVLYKVVKRYLMAGEQVVLWSLFLGGIFIILFEFFHREKDGTIEDLAVIPWKTCVLIGLFQALAVVPGVSRAAASILGGLFLGLKRKAIVEFSFLLAVPTLLAATALDLVKTAPSFDASQIHLLAAGFVTSFVVAMLTMEFFLFFIRKNNFTLFGVYRMAVSVAFWLFLMRKG